MSASDNKIWLDPAALQCPLPSSKNDRIVLGHGSGGRLTADLVRNVFLPCLSNPVIDRLNDSGEVSVGGNRVVFTTDAFVVKPLRFPGGDIGSLSVNGTINDLAVVGAQPLALATAFILEEGFSIHELAIIMRSVQEASRQASVPVVAADTKVVERGKADGMFITTSGIGLITEILQLGPERAQPGDAVLVSGPVGDHGIAVMSAREGLEFETTVVSDCAALHDLVSTMLDSGGTIRCMRDPTRGGVATIINELAKSSAVEIIIDEQAVPVRDAVRAACEILGLDPLYVACEGRLVAIVDQAHADRVLAAMQGHTLGSGARRIGTVNGAGNPRVLLRTAFGTTRLLDILAADQLPRIC
jgi:hydrogenase expression/formation protein HypE